MECSLFCCINSSSYILHRFKKNTLSHILHYLILNKSHVIGRANKPLEAAWQVGFCVISEAELMELLDSLPELPPEIPTPINIPAQQSLLGLSSTSISARPQMLKLNTEYFVGSGSATPSTSPYRLATLATRRLISL